MPPPFTPALGGSAYSPPTLNYTPPAQAFDVSTPAGVGAVTDYINRLNRQGQQAANVGRIPGEANLESQSSANISSELQGQLPADVLRLIGQQGAERGVAMGSPGSANSMAAYLQSLGLTSLDLTERGQRDLTAATARNPAAPLFDPTTQMITPYQQGQLGLSAAEAQLRADEETQRLATEAELQRERTAAEQASAAARFSGGGTRTSAQPSALGEFEAFGNPSLTGDTLQPVGTPTTRWLGSLGYTTAGAPTGEAGPSYSYFGAPGGELSLADQELLAFGGTPGLTAADLGIPQELYTGTQPGDISGDLMADTGNLLEPGGGAG